LGEWGVEKRAKGRERIGVIDLILSWARLQKVNCHAINNMKQISQINNKIFKKNKN